jgi:protein-disulfide isomerase
MSKTFWAVIAIIVIIFGGIIVFNKDEAATPNSNAKPSSHITGAGTSGVTLVEYADYQCPFCAQYYPIVKEVANKYSDKIHFQFRNLPLLQVHQNAFAAARAAEAADKQGKFWEMYDLLFENQSAWSSSKSATSIFDQYAAQLGLNAAQFKKDFASPAVNDIINADIAEFKKTKLALSTPTFFLDGKRIQPTSVDEFSTLIDEAIAAKTAQQ